MRVGQHDGVDPIHVESEVLVPLVRFSASALKQAAVEQDRGALGPYQVTGSGNSSCGADGLDSHVISWFLGDRSEQGVAHLVEAVSMDLSDALS